MIKKQQKQKNKTMKNRLKIIKKGKNHEKGAENYNEVKK